MRLFLFLVGGIGSRVMRPLITQFAAGIHPLDGAGQPMSLEVVPIIADSHKASEDLKRTSNLLRWYKQIRQAPYDDHVDVIKDFFPVKISTLSGTLPNGSSLSGTFLLNMDPITSKELSDSISYSTLDIGSQTLCLMMFSRDQLDTKMGIGFVESPNIGSVILSQFKDSEEFKQFSNVFQKNDRIFVISSIFGRTGAAGCPIIVKNVRNAGDDIRINNRGDPCDVRTGALTVLSCFNIQQDENSLISWADFISKTKSALFYYYDSLTGIRQSGVNLPTSKVSACYYLGDEIPSNPYFSDPGGNRQRNDAHVVEHVDALTAPGFPQISDDQLLTDNGSAMNSIYREYGLANDKMTLSLKDFSTSTRLHVNKQPAKFHLAYLYITHQSKDDVERGYTEGKPEITSGSLSTNFFHTLASGFYVAYLAWSKELKLSQRSFEPFHSTIDELSGALNGITPRSGLLKLTIDCKSLLSSPNKMSQRAVKTQKYGTDCMAYKLMNLLDETLGKLVGGEYSSVVWYR